MRPAGAREAGQNDHQHLLDWAADLRGDIPGRDAAPGTVVRGHSRGDETVDMSGQVRRHRGVAARLSDWYRLEHGKPGPDDAVSAAQRGMVAAIAQAQRDKVISDRLKPQELFGVITALARMGTPEFTRLNPPSSTAAARTAVHDIVKQLVQP